MDFLKFMQKRIIFYKILWGGGRGFGVLYIGCLDTAVLLVARKLCMSIFMHDLYLCILMQ